MTVHELFIDFAKVRREALYNILEKFGVSMKLQMCLNETYSKVRTGKHLISFLSTMV
jgi:hypothetical protein